MAPGNRIPSALPFEGAASPRLQRGTPLAALSDGTLLALQRGAQLAAASDGTPLALQRGAQLVAPSDGTPALQRGAQLAAPSNGQPFCWPCGKWLSRRVGKTLSWTTVLLVLQQVVQAAQRVAQ